MKIINSNDNLKNVIDWQNGFLQLQIQYLFHRRNINFSKNPTFSEKFPLLHTLFSFPYKTTNKNVAPAAAAVLATSLMTSTTMVVFEFFQKKRAKQRRIRAWLLGSWEQCFWKKKKKRLLLLVASFPTKSFWMHQKLWRKFAIIEVALAFYCALAGMARGRASIQFTKLPQVVPVW